MASRRKGGVANKIQKKNMEDGNFTVRESGGTVRSLSGLRSGQVSEILFMDKESRNWRNQQSDLNYLLQLQETAAMEAAQEVTDWQQFLMMKREMTLWLNPPVFFNRSTD